MDIPYDSCALMTTWGHIERNQVGCLISVMVIKTITPPIGGIITEIRNACMVLKSHYDNEHNTDTKPIPLV